MKIDVYSHCIKVTDVLHERDLQAMLSFCKPLIEIGFEKKAGRFIPKKLRTFAAATRDRKEFSFHRNQLNDLKRHLFGQLGYVERLVPITHHVAKLEEYPDVNFDVRSMFPPREKQVGIIEYVLDTENPKWDPIIKMVTLQTGGGKELAHDTPVRIPGGWQFIGSLCKGDEVIARDGSTTTVKEVFPQGIKQLYKVTFEDGRSVEAGLEHLWHVNTFSGWRTISTETIMSIMARKIAVSIPLVEPERSEKRKHLKKLLPILGKNLNGTMLLVNELVKSVVYSIRALGGKAFTAPSEPGLTAITWEIVPQEKTLLIKSITPTRRTEAYCIEIHHPERLYVVNDFIVTHNTYVAQYCMNQLKKRTVIHFKGGYVSRWKEDLEKTFKFKRGDFFIVRGTKDMVALQTMALEGTLHAQVIIITAGTMREYLKAYEESNGRQKIYPINPIDFYPKLNIGFRVTDELHQEFHNNHRIDLYTHCPRTLGLSATMKASDAFKNRMYEIGYPESQRHDGGAYNVYIDVTAIMYHMSPDIKLRYQSGQGYSHTTFEESIMRHKGILKSYLKMIDFAIYKRFVSVREEGQTALVFFARVDLCTLMTERLQKMYPELNVVRYVGSENDSYEDFLEADIAVSTIGSAGTAVDKPNLRCSFMTTAIDSRQSNEQVLGRTRPLKDWPDVSPEFIYFTCFEIEQHMKYMRNKRDFFDGKVLSHNEVVSRYHLALN